MNGWFTRRGERGAGWLPYGWNVEVTRLSERLTTGSNLCGGSGDGKNGRPDMVAVVPAPSPVFSLDIDECLIISLVRRYVVLFSSLLSYIAGTNTPMAAITVQRIIETMSQTPMLPLPANAPCAEGILDAKLSIELLKFFRGLKAVLPSPCWLQDKDAVNFVNGNCSALNTSSTGCACSSMSCSPRRSTWIRLLCKNTLVSSCCCWMDEQCSSVLLPDSRENSFSSGRRVDTQQMRDVTAKRAICLEVELLIAF